MCIRTAKAENRMKERLIQEVYKHFLIRKYRLY